MLTLSSQDTLPPHPPKMCCVFENGRSELTKAGSINNVWVTSNVSKGSISGRDASILMKSCHERPQNTFTPSWCRVSVGQGENVVVVIKVIRLNQNVFQAEVAMVRRKNDKSAQQILRTTTSSAFTSSPSKNNRRMLTPVSPLFSGWN